MAELQINVTKDTASVHVAELVRALASSALRFTARSATGRACRYGDATLYLMYWIIKA